MDRVLLAVVLEADRPQDQVGKQVQQGDERLEQPGQSRHGLYGEQDDRLRALQRQDLGHLLAQRDVKEGDHGQRQDGGDGMRRRRDLAWCAQRILTQQLEDRVEHGLNQLGERVLADPAQQQTGDRHAQLGTRDESGGVGLGALDDARGTVARRGELVYTRRARRNQREFSGDEESVGRDEDQNDEEAGGGGHSKRSEDLTVWDRRLCLTLRASERRL